MTKLQPSNTPKNYTTRIYGGFTIVELLVVISVIGVLVTLLIPAVNATRESSRRTACQSHLRQFGVGLSTYADLHKGQYCSGAFDWRLDGAVTEIGWVADLVAQGIPVGKMTCPSNQAQAADTLNDLLNLPPEPDACVNREGSAPRKLPDGSEKSNPCRQIISQKIPLGSETRRLLVEDAIVREHFNTNYTASWLLVRSRPLLDNAGNLTTRKPGCAKQLNSSWSTGGPLQQAMFDGTPLSTSLIPFLGCGNTVGSLTASLGDLPSGTFTVASTTAGPHRRDSGDIPTFSATAQRNGAQGWWSVWQNQTLQDYRSFAPVHRGLCNLLMADGSVHAFEDTNDDGAINNGFAAQPGKYSTDAIEAPKDLLFSGAAIRGL